jgi:TonB family protein
VRLPLTVATPAVRTRTDERMGALLAADRLACRTRTRRCLAVSMVAHALLLLVLVFMPRPLRGAPALTEFTMLEPGDLMAGGAAPSLPALSATTHEGTATAEARDESFRRVQPTAEIEPQPQVDDVFADRIASRLATLQNVEASRVVGVAETRTAGGGSAIAPAPATGGGGGGPVALNRGGSLGSTPSLNLTRGGGGGSAPAPTLAAAPPAPERSAASAPATASATSARRTLAGASLAGPIADRPVLSYRKPIYPDWAKRDLVSGRVTLYFIVRPDGSVKENILVQQTAGFEDFDESARTALRAWRFAPLTGGRTGEQWGTITFNFRLQEAG